ncbi:MAG: hypothetical protein PHY23_10535 [Oscillospiraceae bacterium]|jgi:hypothetical protein|nr:hypothetical protein [Oscillospiraceae bacterium]
MKKGKILLVSLFVIGLVVGMLGSNWLKDRAVETGATITGTKGPVKSSTALASSEVTLQANLPRGTTVVKLACEAVERMKQKDYKGLSDLIHPEKGVLFAPYSTVDPEVNLTFQAKDIAEMAGNHEKYIWGMLDGKGTPIEMTMEEYFKAFVFNVDYTTAPEIGVNQILNTGNSLENVLQVYQDGTTIEFHIPSVHSEMEGMDWCSLKLVFEPYGNTYKIVAMVHSQWTI